MNFRKLTYVAVPILLLLAVPPAFAAHRRATMREDTKRGLERIARDLRLAVEQGVRFPRATGGEDDPTGMGALEGVLEHAHGIDGGYFPWCQAIWFSEQTDSWGSSIRFRCPGVRHTGGWDVYSLGPDGIDQGGAGDDLIEGDDLAHVGSRQ